MQRFSQPKAALFDAMGTLIELRSPAPALRSELASRFGVEISLPAATEAVGAEISYYRAHLDEGRDRASLAALRRRCAEVIRDSLPELAEVDGSELTAALLAALRFRVFDDVPGALASLRRRGAAIVVVSNWDVSLHEVLARLGLAPLLDGVLTSAEVGERKPDAGIFRRALLMAGAAPAEAIHVGDSVEEDVSGALAAGIEPVLINRQGEARAPGVRVITTLAEL
jgi:putative hydrolase of the HAD superfamily